MGENVKQMCAMLTFTNSRIHVEYCIIGNFGEVGALRIRIVKF